MGKREYGDSEIIKLGMARRLRRHRCPFFHLRLHRLSHFGRPYCPSRLHGPMSASMSPSFEETPKSKLSTACLPHMEMTTTSADFRRRWSRSPRLSWHVLAWETVATHPNRGPFSINLRPWP
ncbi:uncharacterized protein G2W53_041313 [Senna tora]|uniref:Uncharacterized protein n=1 Tax=Senna tora TaxID=362788 RepID=A0A834SJS3_9FABA|nr:uncharacterized protein G2W53_041313 [Senna tora]